MWPDVLAHGLPLGPGGHLDPGEVLLFVGLGTAGAAAVGLAAAMALVRRPGGLVAGGALSVGALLFLFFDLVKEASSLGQGLIAQPWIPLVLVACFAAGFLLIPLGAHRGRAPSHVAWAWIVGIGLHTVAEGWIIGSEAASADLLSEPLGTTSYLLHKMIEAWTVVFVAQRSFGRTDAAATVVLLAGLAFFGAAVGHRFGPSLVPSLLFAGGAGAVGAVAQRLSVSVGHGWKVSILVLLGLIAVFAAGLLHEL